ARAIGERRRRELRAKDGRLLVDPRHVYFGGTPSVRHAAEQPSPFVRLPSSHCSPDAACRMPSPQRGPSVQLRLHELYEPSFVFAAPLSHCSKGKSTAP